MNIIEIPKFFEESNPEKKRKVEQWILSNIDFSQLKQGFPACFHQNISHYSLTLLNTPEWPESKKNQILTALMDEDVKEDLEKAGLINWCQNVSTVLPINVPKDGNCLLHSIATAVWGILDSSLMLRRLLCLALSVDSGRRFHDRWLHHRQAQISQLVDSLMDTQDEIMSKEWKEISQCLDPDHSYSAAVPHRFLESIHVYTMANILQRPIIILTDPAIRTFSGLSLQDNDMGGIYLPLEWNWTHTCRTPILMGFSQSHFCPLLLVSYPNHSMKNMALQEGLLSLVNRQFEQFPLRFLLPGEEPEAGELLRKYLKVKETVMQVDGKVQNILCAKLEAVSLPHSLNLVYDYLLDWQKRESLAGLGMQHAGGAGQSHGWLAEPYILSQTPVSSQCVIREQLQRTHTQYGRPDPASQSARVYGQGALHISPPSFAPQFSLSPQNRSLSPPSDKKCVVPSCKYYGDPDLAMMCSNCFKNYSIKESRHLAVNRAFVPQPTAPLASLPAEEENLQLSMMNERCKEGCGFRCSTKTYPFCHECADKLQRRAQEMHRTRVTGYTEPCNVNSVSAAGSNSASNLRASQENLGTVATAWKPNLTSLNPFPIANVESESNRTQHKIQSSQPVGDTSPTQVLAAASLADPLTPEDLQGHLLFGSGQQQSHTSLRQLNNENFMNVVACGVQTPANVPYSAAQPQTTSNSSTTAAGSQACGRSVECATQNCKEDAIHKNFCGKCYMGGDLTITQMTEMQNHKWQKSKIESMNSSSSSAPASIPANNPKYNTYAKGIYPPPETINKMKTSSLTHLPSMSNNANVQIWLEKNSKLNPLQAKNESRNQSVPPGPQLGMPEKQVTEPLIGTGSDLLASGEECYSSTQRCVGCGNSIRPEEKICQQCRDILHTLRPKKETCFFAQEPLEEQMYQSAPVHAGNTTPVTQYHAIQIPPVFQHVSTPLGRQGLPCVVGACNMFGDPKQDDMCSAHYQQYLNKTTGAVRSTAQNSCIVGQLNLPNGDQLIINPKSTIIITPSFSQPMPAAAAIYGTAETTGAGLFPGGEVSVPPPSIPIPESRRTSAGVQEPSLSETYYRVACQGDKCLNPSCSNYGNKSKRGLCNNCYENQAKTERMISRAILGEEEIG